MVLTGPLSPGGLGRATNYGGVRARSGCRETEGSFPGAEDQRPAPTSRACPIGRAPPEGSAGLRCREPSASPRIEETPATPRGARQLSRTFIFRRVLTERGGAVYIQLGRSLTAEGTHVKWLLRRPPGNARPHPSRKNGTSLRKSRGRHSSSLPRPSVFKLATAQTGLELSH